MSQTHLLVGLGNPGPKYVRNRHNVGFMALDTVRAHFADFRDWRKDRSNALVSEGRIGLHRLVLFKPLSYMNRSGDAVRAYAQFHKLEREQISVIHDDLDLAPGKLRIKRGGGHGGHNGLRSLDGQLGPDYRRLRIGIGHPGDKALVANYVLHDFAKADASWLDPLLMGLAREMNRLLDGDEAGFASRVMQTLVPHKASPTSSPEPSVPRQRPGLTVHRGGMLTSAKDDGPLAAALRALKPGPREGN